MHFNFDTPAAFALHQVTAAARGVDRSTGDDRDAALEELANAIAFARYAGSPLREVTDTLGITDGPIISDGEIV